MVLRRACLSPWTTELLLLQGNAARKHTFFSGLALGKRHSEAAASKYRFFGSGQAGQPCGGAASRRLACVARCVHRPLGFSVGFVFKRSCGPWTDGILSRGFYMQLRALSQQVESRSLARLGLGCCSACSQLGFILRVWNKTASLSTKAGLLTSLVACLDASES